ncbi:protein EFR3 homolog B [Tanacetum coccineum]
MKTVGDTFGGSGVPQDASEGARTSGMSSQGNNAHSDDVARSKKSLCQKEKLLRISLYPTRKENQTEVEGWLNCETQLRMKVNFHMSPMTRVRSAERGVINSAMRASASRSYDILDSSRNETRNGFGGGRRLVVVNGDVCVLRRKKEEKREADMIEGRNTRNMRLVSWMASQISSQEVEPRNRPTQIEVIENVHNGQKGKGEWRVVNVILVNYERNTSTEQDDERGKAHHNWVDEVVSSEARGAIIEHDSSYMTVKPQAGNKDPTLLTRLPSFIPLMPRFIYFDTNRQWVPPNGLGLIVVTDMAYFVESPGNVIKSKKCQTENWKKIANLQEKGMDSLVVL